jgi:hypothetical protein
LILFTLRWLALPLAGAAAFWIALSEYQTLRSLDWARPEVSLSQLETRQPWGGLSGRALAAAVDEAPGLEPDAAEAVLAWQLQRYPLDPTRWFSRALHARRAGESQERILQHVQAAVAVQPGHRNLNWQVVALAYELMRYDLAEQYLRYWLQGNPGGTADALAVASLWIADPADLFGRVLPEREEYLLAALAVARRYGGMELGAEAWSRLPQPRLPQDPALLDFVDLAIAEGEWGLAMTAWQDSFPDYRPGEVPNADFQHELGGGRGLTWRTQMPAGARVSRDLETFVTEPASLRVDFVGRENLQLAGLSLRIPLRGEPRRWVLSGAWRAEGLTTTSLPYLSVSGGEGVRARIDVPARDFDWTPFRVELEVPEGGTLLSLQLRRDPTRLDFDRFLAGRIWLDALRLEPVPASSD